MKISKGEKKRAEIQSLARQVLIEEGYEAFVMRDIANRANMKLGNLQYYFPSKESLLSAVISNEAAADLALVAETVSTKDSAEVQLQQCCRLIIARWRGDSCQIFTIMLFLAINNPVFTEIYQDVYNNLSAALIPLLKRIDPGNKKEIYEQRARVITALIEGASVQFIAEDVEGFVDLITRQVTRIAREAV